jgi:hypothetical protein
MKTRNTNKKKSTQITPMLQHKSHRTTFLSADERSYELLPSQRLHNFPTTHCHQKVVSRAPKASFSSFGPPSLGSIAFDDQAPTMHASSRNTSITNYITMPPTTILHSNNNSPTPTQNKQQQTHRKTKKK